ncbi:MAG: hypothetical protein EAY75_14205 [Bacteroidetes bacterium]|nr:MAG: hypothetical protein EAY75_14205 [Bacteroidota bacterium]
MFDEREGGCGKKRRETRPRAYANEISRRGPNPSIFFGGVLVDANLVDGWARAYLALYFLQQLKFWRLHCKVFYFYIVA